MSVPPPASSSSSAAVPVTTAPQPTPENTAATQLSEAEKELMELLNRKKQVDKTLLGNIIRGFDGYLSNRNDKRKQKFNDSERIFSLSSVTHLKALEMRQRDEQASEDDRVAAMGQKTPHFAMKKRRESGIPPAMTLKKKKKGELEDPQ
ncbi:hypothetical protein HDU76_010095 [Blyttiomyces sp. JEL0837]|nr:hypothetical protein HDU76_010095 [Blyttiomyces sp. JEL0837]